MSGFDLIGADAPVPRLVEGRKGLVPGAGEQPASAGGEAPRTEFGKALLDALSRVEQLQDDAAQKSEALARGDGESVHELMVALGKSDVAFNLMLEVRNKILDAWQTLARTTV